MTDTNPRPTEITYGPPRRCAATLRVLEGTTTSYVVKARDEEFDCDTMEQAERTAEHMARAATEYVEATAAAERAWRAAVEEVSRMRGVRGQWIVTPNTTG